jgi:hypothetical protein
MHQPFKSFILHWHASCAAEGANYELFLSMLCDVLDVPRPNPATPDGTENASDFEVPGASTGR